MRTKIPLLALLLVSSRVLGAWSYDWSVRTDQYGKPAGIFTNTPFALDENSTTYWITNDEGAVQYNLGTLYFVDGARADDTGNGLSLAAAKKTLGAALTAAGSGNKTILVRGAHDSFNGTYTDSNMSMTTHTGTDNTHRFMVCGYNQERPVFDGTGITDAFCFKGFPVNYITIQRLKIQNYDERGVMFSTDAASSTGNSLIDLWVYNCGANNLNDGNIHFYGGSDTFSMNTNWAYHVRSEHTYRKGIKFADHTHDSLIEWSFFNECGYWSGMTTMPNTDQHPYGIDCAADSTVQHNLRLKIRYNIVGSALLGNEVRYAENASIHHNEFYDSVHKDYWPAHGGTYTLGSSFFMFAPIGTGEVYANVFRDNSDTTYPWLMTAYNPSTVAMTSPWTIRDNLFYWGNNKAFNGVWLWGTSDSPNRFYNIYNNTFYTSNSATYAAFAIDNTTTASPHFNVANNIFYQRGAGSSINFAAGSTVTLTNNLYYHPNGSRGYGGGLESGGVESDPLFSTAPTSGSFASGYATLQTSSPAKDAGANLSSLFTTDFYGASWNSPWDIGAAQYGSADPQITTQPQNQSASIGQQAVFSVSATGTGTLVYQWNRAGTNINGGTRSSYTTAPVASGDNGQTVYVVVTGDLGSVQSANATLSITAFNTARKLHGGGKHGSGIH